VNQSRSVVSAQATAVHEALDAHATATTTANSPPADSTCTHRFKLHDSQSKCFAKLKKKRNAMETRYSVAESVFLFLHIATLSTLHFCFLHRPVSAFNADPAAHRIDDVLAPELCAALGWGSIRSKARARSKEEEGKGWSVAAAIAAGPQQTAPGARQVHELLEVCFDARLREKITVYMSIVSYLFLLSVLGSG